MSSVNPSRSLLDRLSLQPPTVCQNCQETKEKMEKCSQCSWTLYCSRECQKRDWPQHKLVCLKEKEKRSTRELIKIQAQFKKSVQVDKELRASVAALHRPETRLPESLEQKGEALAQIKAVFQSDDRETQEARLTQFIHLINENSYTSSAEVFLPQMEDLLQIEANEYYYHYYNKKHAEFEIMIDNINKLKVKANEDIRNNESIERKRQRHPEWGLASTSESNHISCALVSKCKVGLKQAKENLKRSKELLNRICDKQITYCQKRLESLPHLFDLSNPAENKEPLLERIFCLEELMKWEDRKQVKTDRKALEDDLEYCKKMRDSAKNL